MKSTRTWRFSFGLLLMSAMAVGTMPAIAIGTLAPFIVRDFEISRASVGLLVTVLFLVGSVLSPVGGPLVDALGGRRMLIAVFVLSAAALIGMGAAPIYPLVMVAVTVSGLATALLNPTTNKLISLHIPLGTQGIITGVKQSGVQGASFLAGLLLPTLALLMGWRGALIASSSLAVLGIVATWMLVPKTQTSTAPLAPNPRQSERLSHTVRWLTVYAFLMGSGVAAVTSFIVIYSVESLLMSESMAGLTVAMIGLFGMISRVVWARRSERLSSSSGPLAILGLCGVVATVAIWGAGASSDPLGTWLVWVGTFLFGATTTAWNAIGNLVLIRELPPQVTGKATGMMSLGFYGGFAVVPVVFGWLVDVTGSYTPGWGMVMAFFLAGSAVAMAWGRHRRVVARAQEAIAP